MTAVDCAGDHRGRATHERAPMTFVRETSQWVCGACHYARGSELVRRAVPAEYANLPLGLRELADFTIVVVYSRRGVNVEYPRVTSR